MFDNIAVVDQSLVDAAIGHLAVLFQEPLRTLVTFAST